MVKEEIMLGHRVSSKKIEVDREKIEKINKLPPPTTVKGMQSFLGHAGFHRRFIKDLSKITKPLCNLLEKGAAFDLTKKCLEAFNVLKEKLVMAQIVMSPRWELPLRL